MIYYDIVILIKYYIILYHIIVLYYTILFYFIYFILYYLILFYIILYHIISYYTYVYTTVYILLQKKKFQKCATSKYCLLNESWSLRTSATGPGCVQPLLPQHLGIKAMNHVRQAPESHGTASLEAPVINKSVKKNKM